MITISGDWLPPYTVEIERDGEAIAEVIASPGVETDVILVRPDRPLRADEKEAVNAYWRRVYPTAPLPFPRADGPAA